MSEEQFEALLRRNRILLAMAAEERRVCRETRSRTYEMWHTATEIRRRAARARDYSREVHALLTSGYVKRHG
jgi:hypothetical protein